MKIPLVIVCCVLSFWVGVLTLVIFGGIVISRQTNCLTQWGPTWLWNPKACEPITNQAVEALTTPTATSTETIYLSPGSSIVPPIPDNLTIVGSAPPQPINTDDAWLDDDTIIQQFGSSDQVSCDPGYLLTRREYQNVAFETCTTPQ